MHYSWARLGSVLLATLVTLPVAAAELYDLRPALQTRDLSRVEIVMQVGGDVVMMAGGQKKSLPMSVVANLNYSEKLLGVNGSSRLAERSIRSYEVAKVAIKVDNGGQKPSLRDNRRLVAASIQDGDVTLFSPAGPLTREELDLIDVPANTLVIDALLPHERVSPGNSWKHDDATIRAVVGLDAVRAVNVTSTLEKVEDGVAKMVLTGSLKGAAAGVATELELKAKYNFDLKTKRINWFAILIKEQRAIGHVGPGLEVIAKLVAKITPLDAAPELADELVDKLPQASPDGLAMLEYQAPNNAYGFYYDRGWFVTSDEPNVVVLRLMDRGELVAQANISPLSAVAEPLSLSAYQQEIQRSLGAQFVQFNTAVEEKTELGYQLFRVTANGTVADLPIQWIHYLISAPSGQRVSLAFTMEANLAERFAAADRALVGTLRIGNASERAERRAPVRR